MALDHADPLIETPATGSPADPAQRPDIFRALFDDSTIGMFHSTVDGRFLLVNRAFARQLGYDDAAGLIAETNDTGRQHYAVPEERAAMIRQLRRDGHVDGFAVEGRRRDGTRFWCSLSARLLPAADGGDPTVLGTVVDVSELVRTQSQLDMAAAEVGRVFDNAAEGIYRSTPDGRQLRANPALVRLNGYASEAELLAAVNDIATEWYVDPGRRAAFKALLERDGRIAGFESEVYRHKTRERIWVSENAWVVRDRAGRTLFYEGTVIDITERRRAAQALADNEERFRDFAETASDWFWETDAEHRFSYMSPRVSSTYRIPPNRSLGLRRTDIAWDVEAEPEKWKEHQATLDRHEAFRDFTYRNWLEGEEFIHISVSGKPVFDAAGRFRGYRGTARDITEQVQAEERLRTAMMEAEAANQAKISFLANMSHELRTPLNAILGFSEMIRDQLLGPRSPRYAEYAGFISDSGSHLLTLVNDVLDMAKIDAGHMTLSPSAVDLPMLIRRQVAMMQPRAAARGVAIEVDCPADFPRIEVDELRMRQIVLNLLSNAVKFTMAEGRVTATARIDAAGRPTIAIADTGIGMTPEEVALALEPFRQVETHMDRTQEGTGLGLPITRNLVVLHGGELAIQSEPGRGTTVEVILPASVVVL